MDSANKLQPLLSFVHATTTMCTYCTYIYMHKYTFSD